MKQSRPLGTDFSPTGTIQGVTVGSVPEAKLDKPMHEILAEIGLLTPEAGNSYQASHASKSGIQPAQPDSSTSPEASIVAQVELIPIELIDPPHISQRQIYTPEMVDKMAQAIRRHGNGDAIKGQITPVDLIPNADKPGRYVMVDGFTRYQAFSTHFLAPHIKAIVRHDLDKQGCFQLAFSANEERNPASDYDKGISIARALKEGYFSDQNNVALKLGLSVTTVSGLLSFASLPEEVIEVIHQDPSRFGHNFAAKLQALHKKSDTEQTVAIAKKILAGTMPFSKLQKFVSDFKGPSTRNARVRRNSRNILSYGKVKSTDSAVTVILESLPTNVSQGLADHLEKAAIEYLKLNIPSESIPPDAQDA